MQDKLKEREWQQKLIESYQNSDTLLNYIFLTLDSFSYRYLNQAQVVTQNNLICLESREENLGTALKISDPAIKEAVKALAKAVPREEKPCIVSRLWIDIKELSADKGEIIIKSEVSWSHPEHRSDAPEKKCKTYKFVWDDLLVFRKGFPLALEEVCELFL